MRLAQVLRVSVRRDTWGTWGIRRMEEEAPRASQVSGKTAVITKPPVAVGLFRSVSLDVCVGNAACTSVGQSGVRGSVGVCCLGAAFVCVCVFSELC